MGCGKSFVGHAFSSYLKHYFYDIDNLLCNKKKKSISDIFKKNGELFFRKIEHKTLKEFLNNSKSYILALGGGTPCHYENINIMNEKACTVYLRYGVSSLFERLRLQRETRPIISHLDDKSLLIFINNQLSERKGIYERAKKKISIKGKSIEEIVFYLKSLLKDVK
ncbi:MAG TPA: shikimate kinase [Blattabacteriaceae bacterium]